MFPDYENDIARIIEAVIVGMNIIIDDTSNKKPFCVVLPLRLKKTGIRLCVILSFFQEVFFELVISILFNWSCV